MTVLTGTHSPVAATDIDDLVAMLQRRAGDLGGSRACLYLADGEAAKGELSFAQLDRQARAIAARLQGLGAEGECVLLLHPPGLEFVSAFFGCLYAGAIAVPLPVPHLRAGLTQFLGIVGDLRARIVLTTATTLARLERLDVPGLDLLTRLCGEETDPALADAWVPPSRVEERPAYLQFTSGSTSDRKGVMVSHANVIANLRAIAARFEHHAHSVCVNWLPHFHDLGLVAGILQPLFHGHPNVLMSPAAFVQRPVRWLNAIGRYRGTYSCGPNYGYDLCIRRVTPEQRVGLDLGSWEVALNGAEPVRAETIDAFVTSFAPHGFRRGAMYPAYGLAEATLVVTGGHRNSDPIMLRVDAAELEKDRVEEASDGAAARTLVGCGHALDATQVAIVDPVTRRACAAGRIGEIWVDGPGVSRGYWDRSDATAATFHATIADGGSDARYLRTGDLGFLRGGELFVTGRLKDLIVVRGANHYPQDIEWTVEKCHEALRPGCGAAFGIEVDGTEQLIVAFEVERERLKDIDAEALATLARRAVAEAHELHLEALVLLKTGTIPRTSSGKIQRQRCRSAYLGGELEVVAESRGAATVAVPASPPANPDATMTQPAQHGADDLCAWLRVYAEERIHSRLMDERRSIAPHVILDFGNRGVLGLQVPRACGGLGLNRRDGLRVVEQLGAIDLTLAMMTVVHNTLGIGPIQAAAGESIKAHWLPRLATGRDLAAFAITEPAAGSHPQGIRARALPDGPDAWRLHGRKSWSGTAGWASVVNVFVQTIGPGDRPLGISGFVMPRDTWGLRVGEEALTFGMRAMVQNTIHFEGARVDRGQRLGEIGAGMSVAQETMMQGRLDIAAACIGATKRCLQLMLRYAGRRTIATGRLIDNPVLLERVATLSAATATIEALVERIAARLDAGAPVPADAYVVCKTTAPEWLWFAADSLMQFLGGRGYIEVNLAAQILRDARVARILEGPTEALLMHLGSRVANDRAALLAFLVDAFDAPAVAARLGEAADELMARHESATDGAGGRRWVHALIGEVASAATLLAAAGARERSWAEQNFAQVVSRSRARCEAGSHGVDAAAAVKIVEGYAHAIGDVEQRLAGEDHAVDEMLRRDSPRPDRNKETSRDVAPRRAAQTIPIKVTTAAPMTARPELPVARIASPSEIERFIAAWVAKEVKLPVGAIDPARSLLDYGLDSVTAVMLAAALEDRLRVDLAPEIVFQTPVLRQLAAQVAERSARR